MSTMTTLQAANRTGDVVHEVTAGGLAIWNLLA